MSSTTRKRLSIIAPPRPRGPLSVWDGDRVRDLLRIKNLRQYQLALLIDVSHHTVGRWTGARKPMRSFWGRLDAIHNTPAKDLHQQLARIQRANKRAEAEARAQARDKVTREEIDAVDITDLPDLPDDLLPD